MRRGRGWFAIPLGVLAVLAAAAAAADAGSVRLDSAQRHGEAVRPAVVFDHAGHVAALDATVANGEAGCALCHARGEDGGLLPAILPRGDRRAAEAAAHRFCGDCHEIRGRGPHSALCASCHVARPAGAAAATAAGPARFDHDRHLEAFGDDCGRCHHVRDQRTGRLAPAGGEEAACAACHGVEPGLPALHDAAHGACVACHENGGRPAVGPVRCAGCHAGSPAAASASR